MPASCARYEGCAWAPALDASQSLSPVQASDKMSLKLFGQLAAIGAQVVGKIVSTAYKQALANATNNPNIAKGATAANVKGGSMSIDEASKILNCSPKPSRDELIQRFEHLFKANDRSKNGSFYLQSKIVRARETLETAALSEQSQLQQKQSPGSGRIKK